MLQRVCIPESGLLPALWQQGNAGMSYKVKRPCRIGDRSVFQWWRAALFFYQLDGGLDAFSIQLRHIHAVGLSGQVECVFAGIQRLLHHYFA